MTRQTLQINYNYLPVVGAGDGGGGNHVGHGGNGFGLGGGPGRPGGPGWNGGGLIGGPILKVEDYCTIALIYALENVYIFT